MAKRRSEAGQPAIAEVETAWRTVLLCCRKCARKLEGGFGPDGSDELTDVLRVMLRERKQRRLVRLVRSPCFGLCPKGAVAVVRAEAPDRALLVPAGTGDEALADRLLPPLV